jgi:hypothetical protein
VLLCGSDTICNNPGKSTSHIYAITPLIWGDSVDVASSFPWVVIVLPETFYSFSLFPPLNPIFMSMTCSTLRHQRLTKTLENNTTKSLTNKVKGPKYTIFGTHQILPNLHFASPLAKQNEKHIKSKKHKSAVVGQMVAFSICNKPFKPQGIF